MHTQDFYSPFGGPAWGVRAEEDSRFTAMEMSRRLQLHSAEQNPLTKEVTKEHSQRANRLRNAFGRLRTLGSAQGEASFSVKDGPITQAQDVDIQYSLKTAVPDVPRIGSNTSGQASELPQQIQTPAPESERIGS